MCGLNNKTCQVDRYFCNENLNFFFLPQKINTLTCFMVQTASIRHKKKEFLNLQQIFEAPAVYA